MKLTELAALKATRQQWKEVAESTDTDIYMKKRTALSFIKNKGKYNLRYINHDCFLCEYSNSDPGSGRLHNCKKCPLKDYWLSEKYRTYGPYIDDSAICETKGAAWYDVKYSVNTDDDSRKINALRIVAICDAAIKVIHDRNVQRRH